MNIVHKSLIILTIFLSNQSYANTHDITDSNINPKSCIDNNNNNKCTERKHNLKTGFILPQHYRSDAYKIDYKKNNLSRPSNNQQWYKINHNYILLDTEQNRIIQIKD